MEVPFVLTCDYASISDQGKLSAIGIFDRMVVPNFPAVHPVLYLAFELSLSSTEVNHPFNLSVKATNADGHPVLDVRGEMKIEGRARPGEAIKVPRILAINMMPIPAAGRYAFDIFVNDHRMNGAMIEVVSASQIGDLARPGLRP